MILGTLTIMLKTLNEEAQDTDTIHCLPSHFPSARGHAISSGQ